MKTKFLVLPVFAISLLAYSCSPRTDARYIDLATGEEINLVRDESSGLMVNEATGKTVYMYVDTEKNDTIFGSTGKVINGRITRLDDGTYNYSVENKVSSEGKGDDYKVKSDEDGYKIKTENQKIKVDEDGRKVKKDD